MKNAEGGAHAPAAPYRRTRSITTRLTLLYTVSAFLILAVAASFLYWALARHLAREDDRFIDEKIDILRHIVLDHPDDPEAAEIEIRPAFPAPSVSDLSPLHGEDRRASDGRPFRLAAAWAPGAAPGSGWFVQVALDVSGDEAILAAYGRMLAAALVLGTLVSAGAGALVARRALRPVREIADTAGRITASRLHERIGTDHWPDELTELARAFDRMLGRLEDSFSRLSRFSADLAHELRTPINNLVGEAEVALSRARTEDEYRRALESALEEYERLSRMIENLLFLARADAAKAVLEKITLDAATEMEAVREFHDAVAREKGVEVIREGNAPVHADQVMLRRAISNLLSNALRHTPHGGRVVIAAGVSKDGWTEIRVTDTGPGIPPEHVPMIFDRFYRADAARTRGDADGMGLGLSIVKSIMELHGGNVAVESAAGGGAAFTLKFPPR